jgi:hypothetical protein
MSLAGHVTPEVATRWAASAQIRYTGHARQSVADFIQKGVSDASQYRARIYFNKLRSSEEDGSLRAAAMLFEYPSAILCGKSVLHAAGWITQIPAELSVAVLARRSYVSLYGFDIRGRSLSWFRKVHAHAYPSTEKRVYGLRALTPALALADLYSEANAWHPDPDDLDIPSEQHDAVVSAFELLVGKPAMAVLPLSK